MNRDGLWHIFAAMLLLLCSTLRAADCVSVDVELTPEVTAGDLGRGSFEVTNCGDTAGTVMLAFALQIPNGPTIEVADVPVKLGAGETCPQFHLSGVTVPDRILFRAVHHGDNGRILSRGLCRNHDYRQCRFFR